MPVLTPSERQSGTSIHFHASDLQDRQRFVATRSFICRLCVAIRHNPILKAFAERLKAKGKTRASLSLSQPSCANWWSTRLYHSQTRPSLRRPSSGLDLPRQYLSGSQPFDSLRSLRINFASAVEGRKKRMSSFALRPSTTALRASAQDGSNKLRSLRVNFDA